VPWGFTDPQKLRGWSSDLEEPSPPFTSFLLERKRMVQEKKIENPSGGANSSWTEGKLFRGRSGGCLGPDLPTDGTRGCSGGNSSEHSGEKRTGNLQTRCQTKRGNREKKKKKPRKRHKRTFSGGVGITKNTPHAWKKKKLTLGFDD